MVQVLSPLPFHRNLIQSVNHFSGANSHMQLQFRNFPELFVYTVTVPFSRWIIFIYRLSVYRHPPALPPAPLSSLVPLCAMWLFRSKGAERAESLEKHHFCVQSEQNPWKNSIFGRRANRIPGKNRVQSDLNPWKLQHFWVQSEQNPWKNTIFGQRGNRIPGKNSILGCRANKMLGEGLDWYAGEIYCTGEISEGVIELCSYSWQMFRRIS